MSPRKTAAVILTTAAMLFLSSAGTASATETAPPDADHYALPDLTALAYTGDLDGMLERRAIRVLTTYSRTLYFTNRGHQYGLVHDIFHSLEERLNKERGRRKPQVHVVFIPVTVEDMIPALLEGRGDIAAANLTITPEREAKVDFTSPTLSNVEEVLVSGPDAPQVKRLEDLSGRPVHVRLSSSFRTSLQSLNRRLGEAGLPPLAIKAVPENLPDEDVLEMVNAGIFDYTVVDRHMADFWAGIFDKLVVHADLKLRQGGAIAWMIRKDSPQLKARLNEFLATYPEGSLQRNVLLQKYLKSTKFVRNPNAAEDAKRMRAVVDLFRKYGEQYELDFLLMAAQGYQESRLDQNARNPSGAIGVMQVLPSTGKEMGVGDIGKLEPNIHAGIKYIRYVMDRYFRDEPMTPLDKGLFTFASYNAGPARVRSLRAEAERRGLDPNVWFNNVELVAAQKVGSEPVRYVSNIYKYYLAYKYLFEQAEARRETLDKLAGEDEGTTATPE